LQIDAGKELRLMQKKKATQFVHERSAELSCGLFPGDSKGIVQPVQ
jgi:hypothetical protein